MDDSDDIWTRIPSPLAKGDDSNPLNSLLIEVVVGVQPLDSQLGVFPKKTVPDGLAHLVFPGDTGGTTYALIDQSAVKNLPEMLEASGLAHVSLYLGDNEDAARNMSPWLVALDPEVAFTRQIFTAGSAPWNLWGAEPSLILRSSLGLPDLRRHLRKFIRVAESSGRRHFFRYWSPHVFLAWMTEIRDQPAAAQAFFGTVEAPAVGSVLARVAPGEPVWHITPSAKALAGVAPQPFKITGPSDPILLRALVRPLATDIVRLLHNDYPRLIGEHGPLTLEIAVEDSLMRLHGYRFLRHDILTELVVQDIYLGHPFEDEDPSGRMRAICRSDQPQEQRYEQLTELILAHYSQ